MTPPDSPTSSDDEARLVGLDEVHTLRGVKSNAAVYASLESHSNGEFQFLGFSDAVDDSEPVQVTFFLRDHGWSTTFSPRYMSRH